MSKTKDFLNWLGDGIMQRISPLFTGWFTARTEAHFLNAHIQMLSDLEDRARQLEEEGKDHLAEWLRNSAQRISTENPAESGLNLVAHLAKDNAIASLPFMSDEEEDSANHIVESETPAEGKRKRGRPRKRHAGDSKQDA